MRYVAECDINVSHALDPLCRTKSRGPRCISFRNLPCAVTACNRRVGGGGRSILAYHSLRFSRGNSPSPGPSSLSVLILTSGGFLSTENPVKSQYRDLL